MRGHTKQKSPRCLLKTAVWESRAAEDAPPAFCLGSALNHLPTLAAPCSPAGGTVKAMETTQDCGASLEKAVFFSLLPSSAELRAAPAEIKSQFNYLCLMLIHWFKTLFLNGTQVKATLCRGYLLLDPDIDKLCARCLKITYLNHKACELDKRGDIHCTCKYTHHNVCRSLFTQAIKNSDHGVISVE